MTCTCAEDVMAEAERLLKAADAATRRGDGRNAEWARAKAWGCARAAGVLRGRLRPFPTTSRRRRLDPVPDPDEINDHCIDEEESREADLPDRGM